MFRDPNEPQPPSEPPREGEPLVEEEALAEGEPVEATVYTGYADEPVLVAGDAGEAVRELCRKLAAAGHETAVERGETDAVLTNDVYEAVRTFRREHDVEDELTEGDRLAVVGPATWAALNRAA
jgi:peptidoglycan hydrolase-like protein with peptidoglycan-binding domain